MTKQTISVLKSLKVEVDLAEFSFEALKDELNSRTEREADRLRAHMRETLEDAREEAEATIEEWKRIPGLHSGEHHPLHSVYYALKFGKPEHAIDLMRDYINDEFGVAL